MIITSDNMILNINDTITVILQNVYFMNNFSKAFIYFPLEIWNEIIT